MKKNMLKTICYVLLIAIFLTGGLFSLSNCGDGTVNNISNTDTSEEKNTGDITEAPTQDDTPPYYELQIPYNKLKIDANSLVGIAQSDKSRATDLDFTDIKESDDYDELDVGNAIATNVKTRDCADQLRRVMALLFIEGRQADAGFKGWLDSCC